MYKVIEYFMDLQDNKHEYNVGDVFPREGLEVSEERLAELAGSDNKRKMPLIEKAEEVKEEAAEEVKEEVKPAKKKAEKTADK